MIVSTNFLLLLLAAIFAAAAADVTQPQPNGECYCITNRFVNIRSQPCIGEVVGDSEFGYAFTSEGGQSEACGLQWFSVSLNASTGWIAGMFIEACPRHRCEVQCPMIVKRQDWGARSPTRTTLIRRPVPYMFVHTTGGAVCTSRSECDAQMVALQNEHMNIDGYDDIAYSFMIADDGSIYEGTGWYRIGDHTGQYGDDGLAFAFIGSYDNQLPSEAAINSALSLLSCARTVQHVTSRFTLRAHMDMLPVSDPGLPIYNMIRRWPFY